MQRTKLVAARVLHFAPDVVAIERLMVPAAVERLSEKFAFQEVGQTPPGLGDEQRSLVFQRGNFEANGQTVPVESLTLGARKIHVNIYGETAAVDTFVGLLRDTCREVLNADPWPQAPLLSLDETVWIGRLDFDATRLLNPHVLAFADAVRDAARTERADASHRLHNLGFVLSYVPRDADLAAHGLALAPREIKIEPRGNTAPGERMFFTKSPLPSQVHEDLLRRLEERFR